jgi:hypothetical protein
MYTTSSNFSVSLFRKRSFVWILLVVLSNSFVSIVGLAQQPTATTNEVSIIETIQGFLQQLGYNPGPIDGVLGERTRTAIRAFQRDHNLRVDGEASIALVEALEQAKRQEQDKERQLAQAELAAMSPGELYVRAVQCEAQGDAENALRYYKYLMETYPDNDLAVKAKDRFTALSISMPQLTATTPGLTATISALSGTVLVNGQKQKEGTILITRDVIETQVGASVVLELSDGSQLKLGENTKIDIVDLSQTATGARTSRIKMLWGRIQALLSPGHHQAESSFDIETPNALIGVKFSQPDVEVSYDPTKQETVALSHTVVLAVTNLLTGEKMIIPIGSTAIITVLGIKVIAGAATAGAVAAESVETATTEAAATETKTTKTETTKTRKTPSKTTTGIGKTKLIAIGAGTLLAAGGVAALASSADDLGLTAFSGGTLLITASLESSYYGILEATLAFDGRVIDRGPTSSSIGTAGWTFSGTVSGVGSGRHTLSLTIIRQFSSRQDYSAIASVYVLDSDSYIDLGTREATLAAGESITFNFSI